MTESNRIRERDYYLDNAKALLIFLVVVGHFSMQFGNVALVSRLQLFIYTFHMPCFVFVSGYLAKGAHRDGKLRADKVLLFLWMYLLFKFAMAGIDYVFGKGFNPELFRDIQAPWYLFSMAVWYLLVPFIERVRPAVMIIGSILAGVAAGYFTTISPVFSMSRNFVFLPFFVMGFYLSADSLKHFLASKTLRICGIVISIAGLLFYLTSISVIKPYLVIIYGGQGYFKMKTLPSVLMGGPVRFGWYLAAIVLAAAVMQLVPRKQHWFSVYGQRTLQIYILHILVRNVLAYSGMLRMLKGLPGLVTVLVVWGGSALLVVVLGIQPIEKLINWLGFGWLFKRILV